MLLDRELSLRDRSGQARTRLPASPDELLSVLAGCFDLRFPPGTRFACPGLDWAA